MYIRSLSVLTVALLASLASAQTNKPNKTLDIYFVDTEGGLSALYGSLCSSTPAAPAAAIRIASWISSRRRA